MADTEINEIRRVRHEISQRYDHDVKKLISHYQELEKQLRESDKFRFAHERKPVMSQENRS